MKRDLARMESETHDVLVIGGGIVGAAVAHDAALRGFSVALVERDDFCGATSAANAKIIHGGFRYLGQLDAAHVKQFVRERRALETIAPHLVEPVRFVLPIFKDGALGAFFTRVEMTIYDRLSGDKARLDDLDRRLSQGYFVERDEIRVMEPHLDSEMLDGAIVYQECRVWSPERLVLEFLAAACGNRAHVANYAEVKELLVESKTIKGARVIDRLTGGAHDVKARVTINCAGPFADDILDLANAVGDVETGYSQGLNVITRAVTSGHGVTTRTPDGRPLFVVPWRGMSVIGTHDMPLVDGVSSFRVTPNDVHRLLTDLHTALPMMDVSINDVTWAFGGVRPTVTPSGKARGRYAVVDHRANMGPHGFLTALGGDFTNSRAL
ncbi:FAD-dependent oxidoreductase, partial [bacterium]|nr:FAD-dependent oxidoreductase [bacterium]